MLLAVACTVCEIFSFKLYGDLETWDGVTQGHWKCHHSIALVWFPIRLLLQLWLYQAPFQRYSNTNLLVKNRPIFSPPSIQHPIRGETIGVQQPPPPQWRKTRMMGLSGGKRILTKHLAVLIQSTRVTHRQMEKCCCIYLR